MLSQLHSYHASLIPWTHGSVGSLKGCKRREAYLVEKVAPSSYKPFDAKQKPMTPIIAPPAANEAMRRATPTLIPPISKILPRMKPMMVLYFLSGTQ
ncbi:hypothetical protein M513_03357 [Trichuris suis]|uniref:Uncharacterized protein n=1 Tax=Trichuris suis TaxID=68888 RepID=A0A085MEG3_9BILA|nr:hypothetical protein M513_03357 [Trichuris suis]